MELEEAPASRTKSPPTFAELVPTAREMLPDSPSEEAPVVNEISPDAPDDAAPVEIPIAPLEPLVPALPLCTTTSPLDPFSLLPLERSADPPV